MIIIHHRVNNLESLKHLNLNDGAEVDVRYHCNDIVLHHDPFMHHINSPLLLESFLSKWSFHGPLILNIKTEGIENECISLMRKYKINNWFFLDLSMPFFVRYSLLATSNVLKGFQPKNLAVRFSDFEPLEYALAFKKYAEWVWVDTFKDFPMTQDINKALKKSNFKICLVSPELHGHSLEDTKIMSSKIKELDVVVDAVCTKYPKIWL